MQPILKPATRGICVMFAGLSGLAVASWFLFRLALPAQWLFLSGLFCCPLLFPGKWIRPGVGAILLILLAGLQYASRFPTRPFLTLTHPQQVLLEASAGFLALGIISGALQEIEQTRLETNRLREQQKHWEKLLRYLTVKMTQLTNRTTLAFDTFSKLPLPADAEFDYITAGQLASREIGQLLENLDFPRQPAEITPLRETVFDLRAMINTQCAILLAPARANYQRFNLQLEEGASLVRTDPRLMITIIRNLLENAVKYAPRHSDITVLLRETADERILVTRNYGNPIPAALQKVLFDPFTKGSGGGAGNSSGLGLYQVKQAVLRMNGHIELECLPGKPIQFTIRLPKPSCLIAEPASPCANAQGSAPIPETLSIEREKRRVILDELDGYIRQQPILIADTDEQAANALAALFTQLNCPVQITSSLSATGIAATTNPPALLFLDDSLFQAEPGGTINNRHEWTSCLSVPFLFTSTRQPGGEGETSQPPILDEAIILYKPLTIETLCAVIQQLHSRAAS